MFCWKCGVKIPDGSKFCMNCGAKTGFVDKTEADTALSEQSAKDIRESNPPIRFMIKEIEIIFPDSIREYTKRRKDFANQLEPYIRQRREQVVKQISELTSDDIDRCIDIFGKFGGGVSDKLIDTVHQGLLRERIYTISRENVAEMFDNSSQYFVTECNSFLEKYLEIVDDARQLEEYRALKRNGRIYWRGGGFGIKGALTGAAKAGVMNFFTGAIYKGVDAVANAMDRSKIYKSKIELLQSKDWARLFERSLLEDMYQMYDVYASILSDQDKLIIPNLDKAMSETYFKNGSSSMQYSVRTKLFLDALQCYPYSGGVYLGLGKLIGYTNKDMLSMYDYFQATHQIKAYVATVFLTQYSMEINSITGTSYNELDKKISLAKHQLSVISELKNISASFLDACMPYEQELQNDLQEFWSQRLISDDGKHFDSIEDLNLYLEEREEYKKYRQETRTQIVSLERQEELLTQAEARQFRNSAIRQDLEYWKAELLNCYHAKESYSKSFEFYYLKRWTGSDPDKVVACLPLEVQVMLANTPYIPITKFIAIHIAKIQPRLLSFSTVSAWLLVSDFYIAVVIPQRKEAHIIRTNTINRIEFQQNTLVLHKIDSSYESIDFLLPSEGDPKLDDWIEVVNVTLAAAREAMLRNLCPICYKPLIEGAAFCGNCGYKL